jgi:hypothetical protein
MASFNMLDAIAAGMVPLENPRGDRAKAASHQFGGRPSPEVVRSAGIPSRRAFASIYLQQAA